VQADRLVEVLGGAVRGARTFRGAPLPYRWRAIPVLLVPYPFPAGVQDAVLRPEGLAVAASRLTEGLAGAAKFGRKASRAGRLLAYRSAARLLRRR
jgi:hypothetical protein